VNTASLYSCSVSFVTYIQIHTVSRQTVAVLSSYSCYSVISAEYGRELLEFHPETLLHKGASSLSHCVGKCLSRTFASERLRVDRRVMFMVYSGVNGRSNL